jgi:hypothetical protein
MKTKIATLVLLTVTAGSASAHGGEVIAGLVVGAVVSNMIASQPCIPVYDRECRACLHVSVLT